MKYRIREEVFMDNSRFYTERWHESYKDWVAALHCSFDSLEEAKKGVEYYHSNVTKAFGVEATYFHEYP